MTTLKGIEEEKNMLKGLTAGLQDKVTMLEVEKKSIKDHEKKRVTDFFQDHFQKLLAADRAKTKDGTLWRSMNAVFTAYPISQRSFHSLTLRLLSLPAFQP